MASAHPASDPINLGLSHTYAEQLDGLYMPWTPRGFPAPTLVQLNTSLRDRLGLDAEVIDAHGAALFSGSTLPADARPLAQAYAGHQFGGFSPQLGDGRAVMLGEVVAADGLRFDLQLKGSGPTPFSRGGDGKATLGPILREYVLGEAMFHLDVPTSRGLAVLTTGEGVWRAAGSSVTGSGAAQLPGAVLARVAASHLRIGTLQYFAARRDEAKLGRLVAYALARHYPAWQTTWPAARNTAHGLLLAVTQAQATLIAKWMLVGFVHGVMNTDNATLSGETIDYGPCAFVDSYDPATVFSSIDHQRRYAYGNQAAMGQWNLARMGEALLPLLAGDEATAITLIEAALGDFEQIYTTTWLQGMRDKLGLTGTQPEDGALIGDLLAWMKTTDQDYTLTFRRLADDLLDHKVFNQNPDFTAWKRRWLERLGTTDATEHEIGQRMNACNPLYIARNHLVEAALDAAIAGDMTPSRDLLAALESPFVARAGREKFAAPPPETSLPYRTFCGT